MFDQVALNKLILLYVFDTMDVPLQENVLLDMTMDNDWIPYMDCKEALGALLRSGFVANMSARANTPRYTITSDGRECLDRKSVV